MGGTLLEDLRRLNAEGARGYANRTDGSKESLSCEAAASKARDSARQQPRWWKPPQPQPQLQRQAPPPLPPQLPQLQRRPQTPPSLPKPQRASEEEPVVPLVARHASCDFVDRHYVVIRDLGRGSFSEVKLVRERRTGHERVCKYVSTEHMTDEVLEMARTEIRALAALDHPSIVRLYEYAEDSKQQMLVLILEYVAGGDCSDLLIDSENGLSEVTVARLMYQLLVATNLCHTSGIVHRDIKPTNVMLARGAEPWAGPALKLIDFGLALRAECSRDLVGTPAYLPPEVLVGTSDYASKVDIWSIACTAAELLAGEPPFGKPEDHDDDMEPVFDRIRRYRSFGDVSKRFATSPAWARRSTEAVDFVQRLLHYNPDKRPSAMEALSHPWIVKHKPMRFSLTLEMGRSIAKYAAAPPLLRSCGLVLAARGGFSEQSRLGAAFTSADSDDNGWLSRDELIQALTSASVCGWSPLDCEARDIFAALDLRRRGRLCFSEFAAACLYGRHGRSVEQLADQAFHAMDTERSRQVSAAAIAALLCEEARDSLAALPYGQPVSAQEWRALVAGSAAGSNADANSGSPTTASEEEHPRLFRLDRFLSMLFCEQAICKSCEQRCQYIDDEATCSSGYIYEVDPDLQESEAFQMMCAYKVV